MSKDVKRALYLKGKGFVCSKGRHVLYCPDLSKADKSRPFYLHCPSHGLMFEIDLTSEEAVEFIQEFPKGCSES